MASEPRSVITNLLLPQINTAGRRPASICSASSPGTAARSSTGCAPIVPTSCTPTGAIAGPSSSSEWPAASARTPASSSRSGASSPETGDEPSFARLESSAGETTGIERIRSDEYLEPLTPALRAVPPVQHSGAPGSPSTGDLAYVKSCCCSEALACRGASSVAWAPWHAMKSTPVARRGRKATALEQNRTRGPGYRGKTIDPGCTRNLESGGIPRRAHERPPR